ncbi:C2 domain-containing protein [Dioscorea alata]|uniref:C2 domain-containing protein n=1 Tax=Dioscorea alata TaxID=55571 RepID=A0ACB7V876_DIOAL|nr:C2 domain-containing protein [Dioscorea alata]
MASRYEVEVTISSARDLKNVNWRHGDLKPYVVVWIDPAAKSSTKADVDGDTDPVWDEKLIIPLGDRSIQDAVLSIDVVHAGAAEDVKPLIGSARLPLREVVDEAGFGGKVSRSLKLKRPSGRPHGRIEVKVAVKEPARYYDPYPAPYGAGVSRDYRDPYGYAPQPYSAPPPSGYPYAAPPSGYPSAPPPSGYPYGAAAPPPPMGAYDQARYGTAPPPPPMGAYGQAGYGAAPVEKKKSGMGMGTGLAVGAAAGVLGGLALAEGVDYLEDKVADDAAEKVEDDLGYGYGDDDY